LWVGTTKVYFGTEVDIVNGIFGQSPARWGPPSEMFHILQVGELNIQLVPFLKSTMRFRG